MELIVTEDYAALSELAAERIIQVVTAKPDAVLLLATGTTPMGAYEVLARRVRDERIDTSGLRVVQLDEYLDLGEGDRRSLYGWMKRAALEPLAIPAANVVRLPSVVGDPDVLRRDFERAIAAAGGLDLAVLGLGPNGHLGFNEPPAHPEQLTRIIDLTPASIESNGRYWGGPEQTPRRAITAGMNVILASQQFLLLVSGAHKREVLHQTVHGPETSEMPASYLRRCQGEIIADRAAWGDVAAPVAS